MTADMREEMKTRTMRYALAIIRLYSSLQRSAVTQILGRQLLRSGTSVLVVSPARVKPLKTEANELIAFSSQ